MKNLARAAVIGNPIGHSLSPKLHGHWLRHYKIDGAYTAIKVTEPELESTIMSLARQGFAGINVTIPHKVTVLNIADQVSDRAIQIGAANTLTFGADGSILADNTDSYGFIANLRQSAPQWDPSAGPATVFGAGGAARAIIVALADAGVPEIFLTNRTRPKAEALKDEFGARMRVVDWDQAATIVADAATVINTTSLGMMGAAPFPVDLSNLQSGTLVNDIVYNPLDTPLLQTARQHGCKTVDGLGMLLHQGVPGFERWFGVRPEVNDATRAAVLA